jgi:hypothetical protein
MQDSITINDTSFQVPKTWDNLTVEQQLTCYQIIMQDSLLDFTLDEALPYKRLAITKYLMELKDDFLERWEKDCIEAEGEEAGKTIFLAELNTIVEAMTDFAFQEVALLPSDEPTETATTYELTMTLSRCPFPRLESPKKKTKLFAPKNELSNITLYELTMSFTALEQYLETKDESYLHRLLGILYRPGKKSSKALKQSNYHGDRRLALLHHESTIEARAQLCAQLPKNVKQLIVFWFASCRHQIIKGYANIFQEPDGTEQGGNDYGWATLLLELSGGLPNLKVVGNQLYSTGLTYLSYLEDKRKLSELEMAKRKV